MLLEFSSVKAFKFLSALIDWTPWFRYLYFGGGGQKVHRHWYQCNTYITPVLESLIIRLLGCLYLFLVQVNPLFTCTYNIHLVPRDPADEKGVLSIRYHSNRRLFVGHSIPKSRSWLEAEPSKTQEE
jgi:hypothetical protein